MTDSKNIVVVSLGKNGDTSYVMFSSLFAFLSERHSCRRITLPPPSGSMARKLLTVLWRNIKYIRDIAWSDAVVTHVSLAAYPGLALLTRLLNKKLVIFQWDVYPTTVGGERYRSGSIYKALYFSEEICLRLANTIVIPTDDFIPFVHAKKSAAMPLWPQNDIQFDDVTRNPLDGDVVHVAFAGQINELRGLKECVAHLSAFSRNRIALHVFSSNPLPPDIDLSAGVVSIEHHGLLSRSELQRHLRQMHFGLVSLNPRMDQPGYPSKTFDYIAAGLPILYFGRPLPAYTSSLEECGIGLDISKSSDVDLMATYRTIIADFSGSRQKFVSLTKLNWDRFASIL